MEEINTKEQNLLLEFRKRIEDLNMPEIEWHDMSLVRWLRARDHSLKKAEEMIRKSQQWVKENDVGNLLKWCPPSDYAEKFPLKFCGYDSEGSPVIMIWIGHWDVKTEIESGNQDTYLKYLRYVTLKFLDKKLMKTDFVSQFIVILDTSGFSIKQVSSILSMQTYIEAARQYEENYPETLKAGYIVNINKIFEVGFNIIKPFIATKTMQKISMFERNSEKWNSMFKNGTFQFDQSVLNCEINEFNSSFETVNVNAGEQFKFNVDIETVGQNLKWEFKTEAHDIGFGLEMDKNSNTFTIIPVERIAAGMRVQRNSYKCNQPGKYAFIFDNSYSRFRSKTLHYSISVENDSA